MQSSIWWRIAYSEQYEGCRRMKGVRVADRKKQKNFELRRWLNSIYNLSFFSSIHPFIEYICILYDSTVDSLILPKYISKVFVHLMLIHRHSPQCICSILENFLLLTRYIVDVLGYFSGYLYTSLYISFYSFRIKFCHNSQSLTLTLYA